MIFSFEHMSIDVVPGKKPFFHRDWPLTDLKAVLGSWFKYMQENDGWNSLYIENHDQPRVVQRWASDAPEHRANAAKMLAIFHATGLGTLFIYQGQEIGSANSKEWTQEQLRDLEEINYYNYERQKRGKDADMSDVLAGIQRNGRDNARMPMAWSAEKHAGFSAGEKEPWIKVCEDYKEWNVAAQQGQPDSVLEFWRSLLKIRKEHRGLVYGWFEMLDEENEQVYAYTRTDESSRYLVACNFSSDNVQWTASVEVGDLLVSSHGTVAEKGAALNL
jgi:oligo-1,6-glucosidase